MVTSESSPSVNQLPQLLITRRHFPLTEGRLISGKRVAFRQRAERENEFRRLRRVRRARGGIVISNGTFCWFSHIFPRRGRPQPSTTTPPPSQNLTTGVGFVAATEG